MTRPVPAQVHARLASLPGLPDGDGPGLALGVYVDGRLVHGSGHGLASVEHRVPISPYSLFDVASVSKQFTAACVLRLALDGRVDLDADLRATHFRELQLDVPITARQCLHHTAGLRDIFALLDLAAMAEHQVPDDDAVVALLARQRRTSFPPGQRHVYSNSGYILMSALVKRITGKTLREYSRDVLFAPLGMASTHYRDDAAEAVTGRANGHSPREGGGWTLNDAPFGVVGDGGLLTNLVDLARWLDFLQTGAVLGAELRDAMHERAVLVDGTVQTYAGGLDHAEHRGIATVGHGGAFVGFRAHLTRAPDHGVGVAVLGNRADLSAQTVALDALYVVLEHLGVELADTDPAGRDDAPDAPPLRLGLWRDPESGLYARTYAVDGEQKLDALGYTLTVRPAGPGYVLDGLPLPLSADPSDGGLTLLVAGQAGALPSFRPVEPAPAPPGVTGRYRSDELDTLAEVVEVDGALQLRVGAQEPKELRPGLAPELWHPTVTVRVVGLDGRADAIELSSPRASSVRFDRVDG